MPLFGMKMTGSGSRIAALSRPLTSAGVDGNGDLEAGVVSRCASRLLLCSAPEPPRMPVPAITVTGSSLGWPPCMNRHLASLLNTSSPAMNRKSENVMSTTGMAPPMAAPQRRADHEGLDDGGVANPVLAELVDQSSDRPNWPPRRGQVLAHREDPLVAQHLLLDGEADRLLVPQTLVLALCRWCMLCSLRVEVLEDDVGPGIGPSGPRRPLARARLRRRLDAARIVVGVDIAGEHLDADRGSRPARPRAGSRRRRRSSGRRGDTCRASRIIGPLPAATYSRGPPRPPA